jgi:phage-related protein
MAERQAKPLEFVTSSRDDLRSMPEDVKDVFGQALWEAQTGGKHIDAKPLRGFGGASVMEVVTNDAGGTYRAVYTVKFDKAVYVLHVFKKKSKRGVATPKAEIEKIKSRLKIAEAHYAKHYEKDGDDE